MDDPRLAKKRRWAAEMANALAMNEASENDTPCVPPGVKLEKSRKLDELNLKKEKALKDWNIHLTAVKMLWVSFRSQIRSMEKRNTELCDVKLYHEKEVKQASNELECLEMELNIALLELHQVLRVHDSQAPSSLQDIVDMQDGKLYDFEADVWPDPDPEQFNSIFLDFMNKFNAKNAKAHILAMEEKEARIITREIHKHEALLAVNYGSMNDARDGALMLMEAIAAIEKAETEEEFEAAKMKRFDCIKSKQQF